MKKIILTLIVFIFSLISVAQNVEIEVGALDPKDNDIAFTYAMGGNVYFNTHQDSTRWYAKRVFVGFTHSAGTSNVKEITLVNYSNTIIQPEDCNCENENLDIKPASTENYTFKKQFRAVSLNFGVEVIKNWYFLTGVTNLQHIEIMNNVKYNEYRTMHIDAGVKYIQKIGKHVILAPTIRMNPEGFMYTVGFAWVNK